MLAHARAGRRQQTPCPRSSDAAARRPTVSSSDVALLSSPRSGRPRAGSSDSCVGLQPPFSWRGVTALHPPADSEVDATGRAATQGRALSDSVAPPDQATVAVQAAVRLLRPASSGRQQTAGAHNPQAWWTKRRSATVTPAPLSPRGSGSARCYRWAGAVASAFVDRQPGCGTSALPRQRSPAQPDLLPRRDASPRPVVACPATRGLRAVSNGALGIGV
jgi:hypothetical protein